MKKVKSLLGPATEEDQIAGIKLVKKSGKLTPWQRAFFKLKPKQRRDFLEESRIMSDPLTWFLLNKAIKKPISVTDINKRSFWKEWK